MNHKEFFELLRKNPSKFVDWARQEGDKFWGRRYFFGTTETFTTNLQYDISSKIGVVAAYVFSARGREVGHAYLILLINDNDSLTVYDPLSGLVSLPWNKYSKYLIVLSDKLSRMDKELNFISSYCRKKHVERLRAIGHVLPDPVLGRIQADLYNCAPLTIYASLISNLMSDSYREYLNTDTLRGIAEYITRH